MLRMIPAFAILTSILIAEPCLAVDGYKDLKFGMTVKQLQNNTTCKISEEKASQYEVGVIVYNCDMDFNGAKKTGLVVFIDGVLAKVTIVDVSNDVLSNKLLIMALVKKYGFASKPKFEYDNGRVSAITLYFDNDTVIYRFVLFTGFLNFSSPRYEEALLSNRLKRIKTADI